MSGADICRSDPCRWAARRADVHELDEALQVFDLHKTNHATVSATD